ncbi:MAG: hypothetical protein ABI224_04440 [Acetobacteraceae bacterium]
MRFATKKMRARVEVDQLQVEFEDGASRNWDLPTPSDRQAIKRIRGEAVLWAKEQGATEGQVNAVKKALTDAGYYLR